MKRLAAALVIILGGCSRPANAPEQTMKNTEKPQCLDCEGAPALDEASLPKSEAAKPRKITVK